MKKLILPFLVVLLLGIGACDDESVTPTDDKQDTTDTANSLNGAIREDIVFLESKDTTLEFGRTESWYLYGINADGSGRRQILHLGVSNDAPTFVISPDKTKLLFSTYEGIHLVDIVKGEIKPQGFFGRAVQWFPDSKHYLYLYDGLYVTDGNSTTLIADDLYIDRRINNMGVFESGYFPVSISPVGNTVIYSNQYGIVACDKFGGSKRMLSNLGTGSVSYSPDGSKIAFTSGFRDKEIDFYIMNSNGLNLRRIADSIEPYDNPKSGGNFSRLGEFIRGWSPDGNKLLIASYVDYSADHMYYSFTDLYIADLTQTRNSLTILKPSQEIKGLYACAWSKDTKSILFGQNGTHDGIKILETFTGISRKLTTGAHPVWVNR